MNRGLAISLAVMTVATLALVGQAGALQPNGACANNCSQSNLYVLPSYAYTAAHLVVTFTDRSVLYGGDTVGSSYWNFGDGHYATGAHPTHTYASPGTYAVIETLNDTAHLKAYYAYGNITVSSSTNPTGCGGDPNACVRPLTGVFYATNLNIASETSTSVTLNWTLPSGAAIVNATISYAVATCTFASTISLMGVYNAHNVTGLTTRTSYCFGVSLWNTTNESAFTNYIWATPGAPYNLTVTQTSTTFVRLAWVNPKGVSYTNTTMLYGPRGNSLSTAISLTGPDTTWTQTGLNVSFSYTFAVQGWVSGTYEGVSANVTATTLGSYGTNGTGGGPPPPCTGNCSRTNVTHNNTIMIFPPWTACSGPYLAQFAGFIAMGLSFGIYLYTGKYGSFLGFFIGGVLFVYGFFGPGAAGCGFA
jgi:PKD domain